jgi:histidyl-tRNA synthetase
LRFESLASLQSLRGMVDLLPERIPLWQHLEATAREHFRRAAIAEIRTPLLEPTELFARGIGEATDVVGKEMYSFTDRGERSCTLRPEGTASVVRAAIQHGLLAQGPQRLWYGGPMFRYERPQAGRQRQFHQIGVELLGVADAGSDAEAIAIAWDLLADLGVGGLELEINSLGTPEDRQRYRAELVSWLEAHHDQLDPDSQNRISTNPLRVLDSKNPDTQTLLAGAPTLADALAGESHERFARVRQALEALGILFVSTSATASRFRCCASSRCWSRPWAAKRSAICSRCSPAMCPPPPPTPQPWRPGWGLGPPRRSRLGWSGLLNGI